MKTFQEYFTAIYAFLVWMWDETQKRVSSALADAKTFATDVAATAQSNAQVFATGAADDALNTAKAFATGAADGALNTAKAFATDVVSSKSASDRQYALELVSSEMSRIEALAKVTAFLTVRAGDYKDGENLLSTRFVETLLGRALVGKDVIRIIFEYPLGMTQPFKLDEADILVDNGDELILVVEDGFPKMQSRFDNTTSTTVTNHENRILSLEGFKSALDTYSANLEAFKTAQFAKLLTYTAGAKSTKEITDFTEAVLWVKLESADLNIVEMIEVGYESLGEQYYGLAFMTAGNMNEIEIYNEMLAKKQVTPELESLTSDSPTAIWKAICRFFANRLFEFWVRLEQVKSELLAIADARQAGTIEWYRLQILAFQKGYEMQFINSVYQYVTIDNAAKIVTKCAIEETRNSLLIKVATIENNILKPLEVNDLNTLRAYASCIKFAGTRLNIVSHSADLVGGRVTIHHNPELNGLLVVSDCRNQLKAMLNRHEFNGRLRLSAIADLLQSVRGVADVSGLNISIYSGTHHVEGVYREHVAKSGYFELKSDFIINFEPYL